MRGDVGLQDVSPIKWNADYSDTRISSVFAIVPGLIWGMGDEDASNLVQDISLVSSGEDEQMGWTPPAPSASKCAILQLS